ncbi:type II toxin-antitoxin system HicA family toxin [Sporomusa termitida]|uniref:HicA toxin of bacterial toxin-antitoxin n=1 Tax=Sporomusa termitida TaxID=2377 RepID=A0A517DSW5_9FIRM|nr:HicA toxin of bacterial toxin-antitoxin [Sporomusa termitida]
MPMKVREILKLLKQDGWYEVEQEGSHRQFKHPVKKGKVTVPVHGKNDDLTPRTEKSILKQAGLI